MQLRSTHRGTVRCVTGDCSRNHAPHAENAHSTVDLCGHRWHCKGTESEVQCPHRYRGCLDQGDAFRQRELCASGHITLSPTARTATSRSVPGVRAYRCFRKTLRTALHGSIIRTNPHVDERVLDGKRTGRVRRYQNSRHGESRSRYPPGTISVQAACTKSVQALRMRYRP